MADILVVDDDSMPANVLTKRLMRQGHRAESAADLAGGISKVREGFFDVIFLEATLTEPERRFSAALGAIWRNQMWGATCSCR